MGGDFHFCHVLNETLGCHLNIATSQQHSQQNGQQLPNNALRSTAVHTVAEPQRKWHVAQRLGKWCTVVQAAAHAGIFIWATIFQVLIGWKILPWRAFLLVENVIILPQNHWGKSCLFIPFICKRHYYPHFGGLHNNLLRQSIIAPMLQMRRHRKWVIIMTWPMTHEQAGAGINGFLKLTCTLNCSKTATSQSRKGCRYPQGLLRDSHLVPKVAIGLGSWLLSSSHLLPALL